MQETTTWRSLLARYTATQEQKRALASQENVSKRTIDRWISGASSPQSLDAIRNLALLSEEMQQALQHDFPEAFHSSKQPAMSIERVSLPLEFYRRVTHAYAHVPLSSRRWTIWHLVANQMLPHLDGDRTGLVLVYVSSVTEDTLQFGEGAGNTCWTTRQITQDRIHAEQWLMQAVAEGRPFFLQSCALAQVLPPSCFVNRERIQSMGFFPLLRAGRAAGGLLLCSTQEDFFTPLRQTLIEEYSCLFSFAFNDNDFPSR